MTLRCRLGDLVMWVAGPEDLIGKVGTTIESHPVITGPDGKVYHDAWLVKFPAPVQRRPGGVKLEVIYTLDAFLQPIRPPAPERKRETERPIEEVTA